MPAGEFGAFHRDLFERYYQLSEALLATGLIWPALEHCLKCSHLFNILDASNSIGVTERTAYILRVRQLAVGIARPYVDEPAAKGGRRKLHGSRAAARNRMRGAAGELAARPDAPDRRGRRSPSCATHRLTPEAPAETYSTPRRLTVRIARLAERQTDLEELVNGPPVSASFGADGTPTPAAAGFAAKQGVEVAALERVETPKGVYLAYPQEAARQGGRRRAARTCSAERCAA